MRSTELILTLVLGAIAQGCASLQPPPTQTIRLQTPGCAAANCRIGNDLGQWTLSRTPGSVNVSVSRQPLRVDCQADDTTTKRAMAASSRPATSGGGALAGGVAGGTATGVALGSTALAFIPPLGVVAVLGGAAIGAAAGDSAESRGRPLRYPEVVSIPMRCAAADGATRPTLGLGIRGLAVAEATAVGLSGRTAVVVISVTAGGRAAEAGLRTGDVILALNGEDLGDAADMEERLQALSADAPMELRVWRDRGVVGLLLTRATP
jgi:hypothetical protein